MEFGQALRKGGEYEQRSDTSFEVVTKEDMVDFINEYRDVQYKGVMEMDEIATATFGNKLRIIL
ncbi:6412_t:CDS:2 [Rhizophagus irregularis]|nr:6412_t:CDS:2 [Rhizophagus irregularis]